MITFDPASGKFTFKNVQSNEAIAKALYKSFSEKVGTDTILYCKGNKPIRCHRFLLAANSPHFETLFSRGKPRQTSFHIGKAERRHVRNILEFLYKGTISLSRKEAVAFNKAAKKLEFNLTFTPHRGRETENRENNEHDGVQNVSARVPSKSLAAPLATQNHHHHHHSQPRETPNPSRRRFLKSAALPSSRVVGRLTGGTGSTSGAGAPTLLPPAPPPPAINQGTSPSKIARRATVKPMASRRGWVAPSASSGNKGGNGTAEYTCSTSTGETLRLRLTRTPVTWNNCPQKGKRYDPKLKEQVLTALRNGMRNIDAAVRFRVRPNTVAVWKFHAKKKANNNNGWFRYENRAGPGRPRRGRLNVEQPQPLHAGPSRWDCGPGQSQMAILSGRVPYIPNGTHNPLFR